MTNVLFLRHIPGLKPEKPYAYLAIYDSALNVKELIPIMQQDMTPYDFVYSSPKLDASGNAVIDAEGHLEYEQKLAKYSRSFTVAQKDGADRYFFLEEGKDVCDDPSDMYVKFHHGGSLVGHAIEVMARLAQIKRDSSPGFSIGKHWFLLLAVLMALLMVGIFLNGYVFRLGY